MGSARATEAQTLGELSERPLEPRQREVRRPPFGGVARDGDRDCVRRIRRVLAELGAAAPLRKELASEVLRAIKEALRRGDEVRGRRREERIAPLEPHPALHLLALLLPSSRD